MLPTLKRCARETEDWLRYSPRVRDWISRMDLVREGLTAPRTPAAVAASIRKLCAAARWAASNARVAAIQERIRGRLRLLDEPRLDWTPFCWDIADNRLTKAAILKPYVSPRERGVVFIAFENAWVKLLRHGDVRDFERRYQLVIAPSSSPHNLINYVFAHVYPGSIFTLISNPGDRAVLPRVSEKLIPLPLYASHWVNPDRFTPLSRDQRPYDLIMVASWGKVKRHHALFAALRDMDTRPRVLLIGQDQEGRTAETIRGEARWYGALDRLTILANQPYEQVARHLAQARASVVLSRREGSCVVVAESMLADTPVALLEHAEIGSRVFINERTGRFLAENDLPRQLGDFLAQADKYHPRDWAIRKISCNRSTARLNAILREFALARGDTWTRDLATLEWAPNPRVVQKEAGDTMDEERRAIRARYGLDIGQPREP